MLSVAIEAARDASEVLVNSYGKIKAIMPKKKGDLVTNVDLEAERCIIRIIEKHYPTHSILSEETRHDNRCDGYRWIIDPLDGTHNYIRGIDSFGVSIALEHGDTIIVGVISMPLQKELYWAEKGGGAFCNGEAIRVSSRSALNRATMIYDSVFRYNNKDRMIKGFADLARVVFNVRILGSSARHLSLLAQGKADIIVDYLDRPWDFCAGTLLVEEAGGMVTDLEGQRWSSGSKGYVASNGLLHGEVLSYVPDLTD